ncbi:MAG: SEC-C metal-binding domain-containing protein [Vicinamibacterales bacterium]
MTHAKAGRNDLCPCGSGKKFKRCCEGRDRSAGVSRLVIAVMVGLMAAAAIMGVASLGDEGTAAAPAGQVWSPEHGHYHAVQ